MEQFYRSNLNIDPYVVKRVSDYMKDVVQIFSFPLVDEEGVPVALLSVDSKEYFRVSEKDAAAPLTINADYLAAYLEGIRTIVVRCFRT